MVTQWVRSDSKGKQDKSKGKIKSAYFRWVANLNLENILYFDSFSLYSLNIFTIYLNVFGFNIWGCVQGFKKYLEDYIFHPYGRKAQVELIQTKAMATNSMSVGKHFFITCPSLHFKNKDFGRIHS